MNGSQSRFAFAPLAIFFFFLLIVLAIKVAFIANNWPVFQQAGYLAIGMGLLKGLRFDISALAFLLSPALVLYHILVATRNRIFERLLLIYITILAFLLSSFSCADMQYFDEAGKHFTYELWNYLGPSAIPMISGAFELHPWLSSFSLFGSIVISILTWIIFSRLVPVCLTYLARRGIYGLAFPIWAGLLILAYRGGVQGQPLKIGDSLISPNPYINALCLNTAYSILHTSLDSAKKKPYSYSSEEANIRVTSDLLDFGNPQFSEQYPLLRISSGTEQGNRKNVVIFILESWSGKDVGILGGPPNITPFFDSLAKEGMLFTNFYATGLRTAEGMFSILCSFPNQPSRPILIRTEMYQTQWRALSQILREAGYYNIFIHGRSLEFDRMRLFLNSIGFHKIIGRHNFPTRVSSSSDAWPGYNDDEVMRVANEEFSRQGTRPFLGVIYTMNTHPPFVTPPDFPLLYKPIDDSSKFLNSMHYSDYTLKLFFELARKQPYFNNTIFVLVADHARTRDTFNLANHHFIPLLIYSPGYIKPSVQHVVGSQLDIIPTILGLLKLKTLHASWGRDLTKVPEDKGFAVCIAGNEVRWHDNHYLLVDSLAGSKSLLFDLANDPECRRDVWDKAKETGMRLQNQLRAYISLSQVLLYENRAYPRNIQKTLHAKEGFTKIVEAQ